MVTLAVVASAILTVALIAKKRQLEKRGGRQLAYHFSEKSLEFLIPFAVIASLFFLLSLFVAGTSDKTTIERLILFEKMIGLLKGWTSMFKLGVPTTVGLLIIFYSLSLTRIPSKYSRQLLPFFKKYQRTVKTAYMVIVILFSFTFFGTQTGAPAAKLRFRIERAEGKYGELRREVEDAVSQDVARKLLEKVKDGLPKDYREDLDEHDQFYVTLSQLRTEYQSFKTNYKGRDPEAETIINGPHPPDPEPTPGSKQGENPGNVVSDRTSQEVSGKNPAKGSGISAKTGSRQGAVATSPTGERILFNLFEDSGRSLVPVDAAPPQGSVESITEARDYVRSYRSTQNNAVKILQSEYGREMVIQLPKAFTGKVKELVFKGLTDRYPILEPILGVFFGTLDKELEIRTQKAVDKVTSWLAQSPSNAANVIGDAASKVIAETQIKDPSLFLTKARQVGESLRKRTQLIKDAIARVKAEKEKRDAIAAAVKSAETQIANLTCRNEGLRNDAAAKLALAGPQLRQDQVQRIKALLKDNTAKYRKSLGDLGEGLSIPPYGISSDSYYEEVPVKYYAALAVRAMNSPYVFEGDITTASTIISEVDSTPLWLRNRLPARWVEESGLTDP